MAIAPQILLKPIQPAANSREESREYLARGRADRICAIGGPNESHPIRFSESFGEARGTVEATRCSKQPGRSQDEPARRRLAARQPSFYPFSASFSSVDLPNFYSRFFHDSARVRLLAHP